MSRLRKVDRALLESDSLAEGPLDSEDQELLLQLLAAQNDQSSLFYSRVVALSIVVELPIVVLLVRIATHNAFVVLLLVLLLLLSLINCLYDVLKAGELVANRSGTPASYVVSFHGVAALNVLLVLRLIYYVFKESMGFKGVFVIAPVGNLAMVLVLHSLHGGVGSKLQDLHSMRYKYKRS